MSQDETKLMLQVFGKVVSEKELDNYLDAEHEIRQQELETRQDILMGL